MRRFFMLAVLLLCSIPFGISVTGCKTHVPVVYCSGGDSGPIVGQVAFISLQPALTGLSLDQGQIGNTPSPSATDCKGNNVGVTTFTYSTSDPTILDIQPTTGRLCAGTWNRNTGPVADYTICTANGKSGLVDVFAGLGATSNPLPVFVHPQIAKIDLGPPSADCVHDPATNCSQAALLSASSSATLPTCSVLSNGCCSAPVASSVPAYNYSCVSQGTTAQLAARAFDSHNNNISCQVGHLSFVGQTANIFTVDQNGIATAQQPGSTLVSANAGGTSSSAGFFSTCPPASIVLSALGTGSADPTNVIINQNTPQALNVVVKDTNNVTLTGLSLTYNSTSPTTLAGGTGTLTPTLPGVADITATCLPPLCNPAPINETGVNGNGEPLTSNPVTVTTPGSVNTVLYIASTQSQYIQQIDFTQNTSGTPLRLPFVPNSMVISADKSALYLGTATELMIYNPASSSITREDPQVSGKVLAVSPDDSTLVISDAARDIIYLYGTNISGSSGSIISTYGGVATSAEFSPDSQTVYISTTTNQAVVHSPNSGWTNTTIPNPSQSVAVTVPSIGAYLGGTTTSAVSYCSAATITAATATTPPSAVNQYFPVADNSAAMTDQITATNDGKHILGASLTGPSLGPTLVDLRVTLPVPTSASATPTFMCPQPFPGPGYFQSTFTTQPITGVTANSITGITAATDSSVAYVTYTGTGGVLPAYVPSTTGTGTLSNVPLLTNGSPAGTAVAPVAGVFGTDNSTFYAGTSGDNKIHLIVNQQDKGVVSPNLPGLTGGTAVPNLLQERPKTLL